MMSAHLIPLRSPWFLAWRGFMVPTYFRFRHLLQKPLRNKSLGIEHVDHHSSMKTWSSVSPYGHPEKWWDHIHQTSSAVQPARSPYRDTSPSSDWWLPGQWLTVWEKPTERPGDFPEQSYFSKLVVLLSLK